MNIFYSSPLKIWEHFPYFMSKVKSIIHYSVVNN